MSSIPTTMRGIVIENHGGPEVLQYKTDLPVPELKPGHILVKNEYAGVNFIDTYFRTGLYHPPSLPHTLGREAAGNVVALSPDLSPSTTDLNPGARVAWLGSASYAEYSLVPASHVIRIPASLPSSTAAASLFQGLTALTLIREAHRVAAGDVVLVHAAAGGVGLWLVQLLAKAIGARVVATASTEEKLEVVRAAGAEWLVRGYAAEDVVGKVREVTGGKGVVAVFDGVGRATFDVSLECVRRKGSLVCFGNASGAVPPVEILRLMEKNVKLLRTNLAQYIATREEFQHYADELLGFIEKHNLDARIHEIYPLAEASKAHEDIESRKTSGKLLLKV
ncbi:putative quinone oxidoreductase protein [Lasiodiplodia theobromae]|nr:putative quinone oxidoreductase protein [Lasiodiplodia theobromae]